jgi:hypothetical protein
VMTAQTTPSDDGAEWLATGMHVVVFVARAVRGRSSALVG